MIKTVIFFEKLSSTSEVRSIGEDFKIQFLDYAYLIRLKELFQPGFLEFF